MYCFAINPTQSSCYMRDGFSGLEKNITGEHETIFDLIQLKGEPNLIKSPLPCVKQIIYFF